ncbi:hypothetical protein GCM10023351_27410 [Microbacterium gilvum]|uniref:Uncharacterized protein n=1 Tax=Microbacterium gilvum TaxID=1336204 RepID=A0ABP9AGU8_9MICO
MLTRVETRSVVLVGVRVMHPVDARSVSEWFRPECEAVSAWNDLISGCGTAGEGEEAGKSTMAQT